MRVSYETIENGIIFSIFSEKADRLFNTKFGSHRQFRYKTTDGSTFPECHPDRIALVAIMNTLPFVAEKLNLGWEVSADFLNASKIISRIKVTSKGTGIQSKKRSDSGKHCLAFSGGADSTAALAVMPLNTEPVFMLRSKSRSRSLYDSNAALESCRQLSLLGFRVHKIESDFEFLRNPIGFPTDLSVSTPAILISESREFETIAFGTILESTYGTSGKSYRNYTDTSHFRLWSTLFNAVGLGYSLPVAGVSEVGSSILCREHPIGRVHQSCIRGKWGKPCNNCWKCFRKITILAALSNREISDDIVEMIHKSKEVRIRLTEDKPIKHEGVLAYSLERCTGGGREIDALRKLTRADILDTRWMEKWYGKSSELIDHSYREESATKLRAMLGEMDSHQILQLEAWSNLDDTERNQNLESFIDSLNG